MNSVTRFLFIFAALAFFILVTNLQAKKHVDKKISFLWLFGTLSILMLSVFTNLLDKLANSIGIHYPPTLLFLMAVFVLLFLLLLHSVQISSLKTELRELTQYVILMEDELRKDQDIDGKLE